MHATSPTEAKCELGGFENALTVDGQTIDSLISTLFILETADDSECSRAIKRPRSTSPASMPSSPVSFTADISISKRIGRSMETSNLTRTADKFLESTNVLDFGKNNTFTTAALSCPWRGDSMASSDCYSSSVEIVYTEDIVSFEGLVKSQMEFSRIVTDLQDRFRVAALNVNIFPTHEPSWQIKISGYNELHVAKALVAVMKFKDEISSRPACSSSIPNHWELQYDVKGTHERPACFQLDSSGDEYRDALTCFLAGGFEAEVLKIERVQNAELYRKYSEKKREIASMNGGEANEMMLKHGTRGNTPNQIWDSGIKTNMYGFDFRKCEKGLYGRASYFAENTGYSQRYAHKLQDGSMQMFLALVAAGRIQDRSCSDSSIIAPSVGYQSVRGPLTGTAAIASSTESFVHYGVAVYELHQSYPAYLVTYKPFDKFYLRGSSNPPLTTLRGIQVTIIMYGQSQHQSRPADESFHLMVSSSDLVEKLFVSVAERLSCQKDQVVLSCNGMFLKPFLTAGTSGLVYGSKIYGYIAGDAGCNSYPVGSSGCNSYPGGGSAGAFATPKLASSSDGTTVASRLCGPTSLSSGFSSNAVTFGTPVPPAAAKLEAVSAAFVATSVAASVAKSSSSAKPSAIEVAPTTAAIHVTLQMSAGHSDRYFTLLPNDPIKEIFCVVASRLRCKLDEVDIRSQKLNMLEPSMTSCEAGLFNGCILFGKKKLLG